MLLPLMHISISQRSEITGSATARHTKNLQAAALRDMTVKLSEQLFLRINGCGVKRSATNDNQFPAEWNLRKIIALKLNCILGHLSHSNEMAVVVT